jgi:UrcA family protein
MRNTTVMNVRTARSILTILVAAFISTASAVSGAGESFDAPPQKVVSYKDLDLNKARDVAVLYGRIQRAAHEVCGNLNALELVHTPAAQECIAKATERSVADVGNPVLSNLFSGKAGKPAVQIASIAR